MTSCASLCHKDHYQKSADSDQQSAIRRQRTAFSANRRQRTADSHFYPTTYWTTK